MSIIDCLDGVLDRLYSFDGTTLDDCIVTHIVDSLDTDDYANKFVAFSCDTENLWGILDMIYHPSLNIRVIPAAFTVGNIYVYITEKG